MSLEVEDSVEITAEFPAPDQTVQGSTQEPTLVPGKSERDSAHIEASIKKRLDHLLLVERGGPDAIALELLICEHDIFHWFEHYAWTYDPRNVLESPPLPAWQPFDLFDKQKELINWFEYLQGIKQDGCLKKSRDIGFTWLAAGVSWHKWRFSPGFKTTFGSRKAEYVDRIGDPDSIFEKVRLLYQSLPRWMLPVGFAPYSHDNHMLLLNPENGNTIRGESGEDMGRGGRSTLYFIDEAASIEHADRVDAATSANSEVRIWGSSINPQNENNLFQRKYTSFPPERVFRFHYSDDPRKTKEWALKKQSSVSPEVWASEYEIDDSYTVEDICIPTAWVNSAKRIKDLLHAKVSELRLKVDELNAAGTASTHVQEQIKKYTLEPALNGIAGGDVGGGKASSTLVARLGSVVLPPKAWKDPDTIDTAFKMLDACTEVSVQRSDGHIAKIKTLRYDNIGVGLGVTSSMKRHPRPGLTVVGVNVGEPASDRRWPDGEESKDKFVNLKAEGWWSAREMFKRTHEMVAWLEGKPEGHEHPLEDIISIPDGPSLAVTDRPLVDRLCQELSQVKWNRNEKGKIMIESKASLSKRGLASPDVAEGFILTYAGYSKAEKWAKFATAQF